LTDFVDFVIKAGSPKLTKVREIATRARYSPAFDFWKTLREHIADFHRVKAKFDFPLESIHAKKRRPYDGALLGYRKFLSRIEGSAFFEPPSERWTCSGLVVRVNPELGLCIDGKRYVVKLYFKNEEPTKHRLHAVLELMKISLKKGRFEDVIVAVLDVGSAKLTTPTKEDSGFLLLLQAEASAFMSMWNAMAADTMPRVKRASA
jgi:hypothetical protein